MKLKQTEYKTIEIAEDEVDRLRGIIRNEHDYNNDLLESNKLKFHKIVALEAELSARKDNSEVLMKVVEIVKRDDNCPTIINQLADLLVDYLDAPEGPHNSPTDSREYNVSPDNTSYTVEIDIRCE